MTIVVMGATGRTGGRIARGLLESGHAVRVLGRNTATLAPFWDLGAEVRAGDPTDESYLTRTLQGADALYALLPHDPTAAGYLVHSRQLGETLANAVRESGVRHVVFLSSLGAEHASGTGAISVLHDQEARLRDIADINVMFLRPASFFEVFDAALPMIAETGVLIDSVDPDLAVPMIATRDIAAAARRALSSRDWSGVRVQELLGPRDLTYREVARILGRSLGLPDLQYVQVAYDEMARMLEGAGFARDIAELTVGISRGVNERRIGSTMGRSEQSTTPTTFEDHALTLAATLPRSAQAPLASLV